jgi:hypothetical protein
MRFNAALVIALVSLVSCSSLGDAPEHRGAIEADFEFLGKLPSVDVAQDAKDFSVAMAQSAPTRLEAIEPLVMDAVWWMRPRDAEAFWSGVRTQFASLTGKDLGKSDRDRISREVSRRLLVSREDGAIYSLAANHAGSCTFNKDGTALPSECKRAAEARDELIGRFVVRIQDYHEANYGDVFATSAVAGLWLDVGVVVAAALATAAPAASAKTAWAAVATILGGTKLAASKNVLSERSSAAVLSSMMALRTESLQIIVDRMPKTIHEYSMAAAMIDLSNYFNAGGLHKAQAAAEQKAAKREADASAALKATLNPGKDPTLVVPKPL